MAVPDISIVTPVWNGARYLARCIESVIGQTHGNWEQLVVDDGSTDESFEIASTFAERDPRVRVFRQRNRGSSAARNVAIGESRGAQIAYLDADDEYYPDFLANAVRVRGRGDVLVFCYDIVNEDAGHAQVGATKAYDPSKHLGRLAERIRSYLSPSRTNEACSCEREPSTKVRSSRSTGTSGSASRAPAQPLPRLLARAGSTMPAQTVRRARSARLTFGDGRESSEDSEGLPQQTVL